MKKTLLLVTFLLLPFVIGIVYGGPPPPPDGVEIPLDGGLTALIAAGLVYGARKLYLQQKNDEDAA